MGKVRLCALFLLCVLLLTACTAEKTAHTYSNDTHTHVYGNRYDVVVATCLTAGTVVRYCKICHEGVTESVAVPADIAVRAHTFSDTVVAPTEATEGYTVRSCMLCEYVIERAFVVPARYALLETAETLRVAPQGAVGAVVADATTHALFYHVAGDSAVSSDLACHLAVALTLTDALTSQGADITLETTVSFEGEDFPVGELLFEYIEKRNTAVLRALALVVSGSESGFAELVAARLARLGVGDAIRANPFSPAENRATLGACAVLLARVLDEPLLTECFGAMVERLQRVAGQKPLLYLTSADGTFRVTAISVADGVRFSLVCGGALPADYEDVLYPTV